MKKKILFVVTSHDKKGSTGEKKEEQNLKNRGFGRIMWQQIKESLQDKIPSLQKASGKQF